MPNSDRLSFSGYKLLETDGAFYYCDAIVAKDMCAISLFVQAVFHISHDAQNGRLIYLNTPAVEMIYRGSCVRSRLAGSSTITVPDDR